MLWNNPKSAQNPKELIKLKMIIILRSIFQLSCYASFDLIIIIIPQDIPKCQSSETISYKTNTRTAEEISVKHKTTETGIHAQGTPVKRLLFRS